MPEPLLTWPVVGDPIGPPLGPLAIAFRDTTTSSPKGGAVVYWKNPATTGTSPIQYYTVTQVGGPSYKVPTPLVCRQVFLGLTLLQPYAFTITATNYDGQTSPVATTNTIVPPGLAGTLPLLFLQIQAQITADCTLKGIPVPEMQWGEEYRAENSSFDRIVFFPEQSQDADTGNLQAGTTGMPKMIGNESLQIASECWGGTLTPPPAPEWTLSTSYATGTTVLDPSGSNVSSTAVNPGTWVALNPGTSGATNPFPSDPQYGQQQIDNGITWQCVGNSRWTSINQYGATQRVYQQLNRSLFHLYGRGPRNRFVGVQWSKHNGEVLAYGTVATYRFATWIPFTDDWTPIGAVDAFPILYSLG